MTRALALGLLGLSLFTSCGEPAQPRKNVVLVVIDTLRADRTSLYGGERTTTPAIDEWAQRGAVFEHADSASSWTVPSMGMLLTGRYRHGGGKTLADSQRLLSQVLQGAGYRTIGIVANPVLNSLQGFDVEYEQYDLTVGDYETPLTERRWGWQGSVVVDKGIRWMREFRDERPFMLYLHLMDPHFPYAPVEGVPFMWEEDMSSERRARFEAKLAAGDAGAITEKRYKGMERMLASYDAEILETDQELKRLFDYLDESGLSEDTVVVLTSDHGEGLWEHSSKDGWVNEASFAQSIVPELYRGHGEQLFGELVVDVEVGVHVGHVLMVIECVHEPKHLLRLLVGYLYVVLWNHRQTGRLDSNPGRLQPLLDRFKVLHGGVDGKGISLIFQILGAGFKGHLQQLVFRGLFRIDEDVSFSFEYPLDTASFCQISPLFGEDVAQLGNGSVLVIREDLDQHGHASGTVSLIGDRFVGLARQFARSLHDGTLDIGLRHIAIFGRLNGRSKPGIGVQVAPAKTSCHADFLDQTGKEFSPFGVGTGLFVLDGMPLGMS